MTTFAPRKPGEKKRETQIPEGDPMTRRTLTVNQPRRKPRPDPYSHPRCPSVDPTSPSVRCLLDAGHHTDRHFAGGREWVDTPAEDVA